MFKAHRKYVADNIIWCDFIWRQISSSSKNVTEPKQYNYETIGGLYNNANIVKISFEKKTFPKFSTSQKHIQLDNIYIG